jgi:hypothetical protein
MSMSGSDDGFDLAGWVSVLKQPSCIPGFNYGDIINGTMGMSIDRNDARLQDPELHRRVAEWLKPDRYILSEMKEVCTEYGVARTGNKKVLALRLAFKFDPSLTQTAIKLPSPKKLKELKQPTCLPGFTLKDVIAGTKCTPGRSIRDMTDARLHDPELHRRVAEWLQPGRYTLSELRQKCDNAQIETTGSMRVLALRLALPSVNKYNPSITQTSKSPSPKKRKTPSSPADDDECGEKRAKNIFDDIMS